MDICLFIHSYLYWLVQVYVLIIKKLLSKNIYSMLILPHLDPKYTELSSTNHVPLTGQKPHPFCPISLPNTSSSTVFLTQNPQ